MDTERKFTLFACSFVFFLCLFSQNSHAWDPIRDITGKRLDQHFKSAIKDLKNAPSSWGRCISNPGACAEKEFRRIPYRAVWPIIERYKAHLFNQAQNRWNVLPPQLIQSVQPYYSVDLRNVRFATNINTVHGSAITWDNFIFFPRHVNLSNRGDLRWMLHELEHAVQYQRRGGYRALIGEYALKAMGKIIERGTFNPHDYIDLERAADAKANQLIGIASVNTNRQAFRPGNSRYFRPSGFAQICATVLGYCFMGQPISVGSQCLCPTQFGPVAGLGQ